MQGETKSLAFCGNIEARGWKDKLRKGKVMNTKKTQVSGATDSTKVQKNQKLKGTGGRRDTFTLGGEGQRKARGELKDGCIG